MMMSTRCSPRLLGDVLSKDKIRFPKAKPQGHADVAVHSDGFHKDAAAPSSSNAVPYIRRGRVDYLRLMRHVRKRLVLIVSRPTVPDSSSWQEASDLIDEYGLDENGAYELPAMDMMRQGLCGDIEDTPGDDHPAFALEGKTENVLVGNNERAVMSAAYEAENLGYNPVVLGCTIEGEAGDVAGVYTSLAEQLIKHRGQRNESFEAYSLGRDTAAIIAGRRDDSDS